jgi:hypothetical protein
VLAAAATDVAVRVAALRSPALRARQWPVLALVAVLVATALDAARDTEQVSISLRRRTGRRAAELESTEA